MRDPTFRADDSMGLLDRFRTPAHAARDPRRRLEAIASASAETLADLARNDPDAGVRRAAVSRLSDLSLLGDRWRHDADEAVRSTARERLLTQLLRARAPAEGARFIGVEDDAELLADVATRAELSALRRAALERIARPALLAQRCVADPDPALRRWLLTRIDDPAALARIAEQARRSDKVLSREARERLEATRLAAGDPAALAARALALGEAFDALRRSPGPDLRERAQTLFAEWSILRDRLDAALVRRVDGHAQALRDLVEPREVEPAPAPMADLPPSADAPAADPSVVDPSASCQSPQAGGAKVESATAPEEPPHPSAAEPALPKTQVDPAAQERALAALRQAIEDAEAAAEAQQATALRTALDRARAARRGLARIPGALLRRFERLGQQSAELDRWQHWADARAREALCDEAEGLSGAGLHPDAVATRARELRDAWSKLGEAGGRAPLAGRFNAALQRALDAARPYFERRDSLRRDRLATLAEWLARAEHASGEAGVLELARLRRDAARALRSLPELPPRERPQLSQRLRALLARTESRRSALDAESREQRQRWLARLKRELAHADPAEAALRAREARREWPGLPRLPRELQAAFDAELEALLAPVEARDRATQQADSARREAEAARRAAILAEVEALAADATALSQADARLAVLAQRWRELDVAEAPAPSRDARAGRLEGRGRAPTRDPKDRARARREDAFDLAADRVRRAAAAQAEVARTTALNRAFELDAELARIEAGAPDQVVATTFRSVLADAALEGTDRGALTQRLDAWLDGAPAPDDAAATLRALVVDAEAIQGIDSAPEDSALRRERQLTRLAAHLRGEHATGQDHALRELRRAFLALTGVDERARAPLRERMRAALSGSAPS